MRSRDYALSPPGRSRPALQAGGLLVALLGCGAPAAVAADQSPPPNIILIVCDNLGNGDLGAFGSRLHRTPHVDRLAEEGTKFTSFYVASGVCTPSRAAILTGCYPRRLNLHESAVGGAVLQPVATRGLHPDETTLAEVLRAAGYATACIGKWHLGDQPPFLPTRQGFEYFFGIPYSDDMTRDKRPQAWPELPLMRGEEVIEAPVDRDHLVRRCTEEAIRFLEAHARHRFFLYLPHTMPGSTPHPFSSPAFRGKSRNGAYGDCVEELDWSTGEILAALDRLGLAAQTLVIWTSDNGAVRRDPPQGSNAPYRGWGYDTSEGAMRVPCVMRWPGVIPAGAVQDELCSTLDLLPTIAGLAGAPWPRARLDGHNILPLLAGAAGARSPWDDEGFCFYRMGNLQAVRAGPWKLYFEMPASATNQSKKKAPLAAPRLFDVRRDLGEDHEVAAQHPAVVARLTALADRTRTEIGDGPRLGPGQRPAGAVETATPLLLRRN
jgi:arylsulfatase A-like enzyme